jgi:hypothetical protein
VCRIKDQSGNIPVREECLDAGKSVQHGRKVMAGSTLKDRVDRQSRVGILAIRSPFFFLYNQPEQLDYTSQTER